MAVRPDTRTFTGSSMDVLNAIRQSASMNYRGYVPVASDGADIKTIGAIIMDYPSLQNEFLNALVNRIGRVILQSKDYSNPWQMFKKGQLEYGEIIEEVFIDLAKPFQYDPEASETNLYKRETPDVRSAFHVLNFQKFYKVTIFHQQLKQAFLSEGGVVDLVQRITQSMYQASEYDEFLTMKYLLARNALNGRVTPVELPALTTANMNAIVSKIKSVSNDFEFMKPTYNTAHVKNFCLKEDQYLILNTDFDAKMNVEVLAAAFNMDKASFAGHRVLVDSFGFDADEIERLDEIFANEENYTSITPTESELLKSIPAIIADKDYFMIFDNDLHFNEKENPEGRYWNYWYHVWKIFSVSPFNNNAMFVHGAPIVNSVTISPTSVTTGAGSKIGLTATVSVSYFAPKTVVWESDNELVTVNASGTVEVSTEAVTGTEVEITATSTFDATKSDTITLTVS